MAVDNKIIAVLLLELGRLGHNVACDDGGVAPIRFLQGVGKDIFTNVIDPSAVIACLMRKRRSEEFVRVAARSSPRRIAVSTWARSHAKSVFRWLRISGELK